MYFLRLIITEYLTWITDQFNFCNIYSILGKKPDVIQILCKIIYYLANFLISVKKDFYIATYMPLPDETQIR